MSTEPPRSGHSNSSAKIHENIVADISKTRSLVPSSAVLINNPDVSVASEFGVNKSFKHVKDSGVPGGKAIEVNVRKPVSILGVQALIGQYTLK